MLKLDLFPTARIAGVDSSVRVPAEMVSPAIAVTPCLSMADGVYAFGGGFTITHAASGRAFTPGQACLACARHVAGLLAATTVDWEHVDFADAPAFKASLGDQFEAVVAAIRLFGTCEQHLCFHEEQPCGACGATRQHASYCIHVVLPMVAGLNAAAGV